MVEIILIEDLKIEEIKVEAVDKEKEKGFYNEVSNKIKKMFCDKHLYKKGTELKADFLSTDKCFLINDDKIFMEISREKVKVKE